MPGHRQPTVLIYARMPEHLEILRGPSALRLGVVEGVDHAHPFDRLLLGLAVQLRGVGHADDF